MVLEPLDPVFPQAGSILPLRFLRFSHELDIQSVFVVESPVNARPWLTLGFKLGSDPVFRIYTEEAPEYLTRKLPAELQTTTRKDCISEKTASLGKRTRI
ncbi:unnamed protein product [Rangifer tarandus platyrhynchus]|uniref:Uncharacterized protein n=2 Tax=Rangifer tarandus platyrhynchus TaxID=3082113 RepID=A0AC59Y285_RANTA|nr:unnamed protein product [Rangifer tarandus platyrhynchus]